MTTPHSRFRRALSRMLWVGLLLGASTGFAQTSASGGSELVTWTCTGSPCPWGSSDSGHALVWPASAAALDYRFGYTVSQPVYLPAALANGATIQVVTGSAALFAGFPSGSSHRMLGTVSGGGAFAVSGLAEGEVLSVQSLGGFTWQIELPEPPEPEVPPPGTTSVAVTWSCTSSPCPWGTSTTGHAIEWPESAEPSNTRLGYTASSDIYLPKNRANGAVIWIDSGSATVFAGLPGADSHRVLTTINVGEFYEVSGLTSGEVLSVQSEYNFTYQIDLPPPPPDDPEEPGPTSPASQHITWSCTGSPCPWGTSLNGHAVVWPETANPMSTRFGYTTSAPIYLPSHYANGAQVSVGNGSASLFAGLPGASSHRHLATIGVGDSYAVSGLASGEVLSVQSESGFHYEVQLPDVPPEDPGDVIHSVDAFWRCDLPDCASPDWVGGVITWPSWAAYPNNSRQGDQSRTVYSANDELLYPYMGSWAHGCQVTAKSGTVLIIEWERGTDVWRETFLGPGDTHTIQLTSPEDGAMIETADGYSTTFSVTLSNCTPQPLP